MRCAQRTIKTRTLVCFTTHIRSLVDGGAEKTLTKVRRQRRRRPGPESIFGGRALRNIMYRLTSQKRTHKLTMCVKSVTHLAELMFEEALTFLWFHITFTLGLPRRAKDWSMTSSWTKLAVWIISEIMAICRCACTTLLWRKKGEKCVLGHW